VSTLAPQQKAKVTFAVEKLKFNQMSNVQREWEIGLGSWIIQDGNYDNFQVEQNAEFALEFFSKIIRKGEAKQKFAKRLGGAKYSIYGEVIYLTQEVWVLDFGICAFQESKPPEDLTVGSTVAAEIYLGIDPFFYFEYLYTLKNMPPLIYSWRIDSIGQQTAPFIEPLGATGQKALVRDKEKLGFKPIKATDAWKDDGGNAEYLLLCTQLDLPPKFKITNP
jgi:hypothetical protein